MTHAGNHAFKEPDPMLITLLARETRRAACKQETHLIFLNLQLLTSIADGHRKRLADTSNSWRIRRDRERFGHCGRMDIREFG